MQRPSSGRAIENVDPYPGVIVAEEILSFHGQSRLTSPGAMDLRLGSRDRRSCRGLAPAATAALGTSSSPHRR
jgi:hypothetical protein